MSNPVKIFIAYARDDGKFLDELRKHFMPLKRSQNIEIWYDGKIEPGVIWDQAIRDNMHQAHIILLLLSASAIASDYFYNKELKNALERHEKGLAQVVPFILKPCTWQATPLAKLQALPKDGKAVTKWADKDEAYNDAVDQIWSIIKKIEEQQSINTKKFLNLNEKDKIKAVIVDDEEECIIELEKMINKHCPELNIIKTFQSSKEAYLFIQENNPDLLFLDIRMPYLNGIKLLDNLGYNNYNCIFVTASKNNKIDAIRLNAIDYLIKDVFDHVELIDAVERAKIELEKQQTQIGAEFLKIRKEKDIISLIKIFDIIYFESKGNKTELKLKDDTIIESIDSLELFIDKLFKNRLTEKYFFCCNDKNIINMYEIEGWDGNYKNVKMLNNDIIQISSNKKNDFIEFIESEFL